MSSSWKVMAQMLNPYVTSSMEDSEYQLKEIPCSSFVEANRRFNQLSSMNGLLKDDVKITNNQGITVKKYSKASNRITTHVVKTNICYDDIARFQKTGIDTTQLVMMYFELDIRQYSATQVAVLDTLVAILMTAGIGTCHVGFLHYRNPAQPSERSIMDYININYKPSDESIRMALEYVAQQSSKTAV